MTELTVASFNIHWGFGGRRGGYPPFDVAAACEPLDADVLLLLESWAPFDGTSTHDAVAAALGLQVLTFVPQGQSTVDGNPRMVAKVTGVPPHPDAQGHWGTALLSRSSADAVTVVPLPSSRVDPVERALVRAELPLDGATLTVCGLHFTHYHYGSLLHRGALRRALPPSSVPAVLMGDFNQWGFSVDWMVPSGWQRRLKGKTFPARAPQHQIDHLLATSAVEVSHAEVLPDLGSDHRAIRARVRLR